MQEAVITINGSTLTPEQVLALRIACTLYRSDLACDPNKLGADADGRKFTGIYLDRLTEVLALMTSNSN